MNKGFFALWMLLAVIGAIFLTGCSTPSNTCTNDNVCTLNEELNGACDDCRPDFIVDEREMYAYYDSSSATINADICVKNTGGNYEGDVEVGWHLSSNKEGQGDYTKERVYFSSPSAQSHAYLTVKNHQLLLDQEIRFGKDEQYSCFSKQFTNVRPSTDFYVYFQIYAPDANEKNENNNWGSTHLEGVGESYPDYLIEENLGVYGEFNYMYSEYENVVEEGYNIQVYQAGYQHNNQEYYYAATNAVFDSSNLARTFLDEEIDTSEYAMVQVGYNGGVYIWVSDEEYDDVAYIWPSGSSLILVNRNTISSNEYPVEDDAIVNAYLSRFPSDMSTTIPTEIQINASGNNNETGNESG